MISVALALVGAAIYGGSGFLGGLAARAMSSIRVTALNSVVGFTVLLLASLVLPTGWSWDPVLWGGLRGLAGAVGAGLSIGTYLVFIDLSPSNSGPAPLGVCFAATGIAMGLLLLFCRRSQNRPQRRSVIYALLCGLTDGVAAFVAAALLALA